MRLFNTKQTQFPIRNIVEKDNGVNNALLCPHNINSFTTIYAATKQQNK